MLHTRLFAAAKNDIILYNTLVRSKLEYAVAGPSDWGLF
jgi:hypothetical protein